MLRIHPRSYREFLPLPNALGLSLKYRGYRDIKREGKNGKKRTAPSANAEEEKYARAMRRRRVNPLGCGAAG